MMAHLLELIYLIGSVTFMVGLKMLSKPDTARRGNLIAAFGMGIAILGTIFLYKTAEGGNLGNLIWIFAALVVGAIIGVTMAKRVQMTAMPQMVSFFNGMGGACAALISIIEFQHVVHMGSAPTANHMLIILAGLIIGSVSFSGSVVAYGKLEGKIDDFNIKGQQFLNVGLVLGIIVLAALIIMGTLNGIPWFYIVLALSILYGLIFVLPIGGADMPVVISLLNSFTGVAAACGGFLYGNYVMLIGGILVGSAGTLLTVAMCNAMNRSLLNVLVGNFGGGATGDAATSGSFAGSIKEVSLSDAAILLKYAKKAVIVPGYGLAVAQAQYICHELEAVLEEGGVVVKYAIHPVAGRMPGHMNVLLAESNVSYDKLVEMEDINPEFGTTDVVLVVGANDVVNPAAKTDPNSPIYGMPILEVEDAKSIIIMKRSMKAGYAGIENELFYKPKSYMLFGDAKDSLTKLVSEVKSL
ncbi:MAG: NAD(P)(+) transhydrogenase (Re/Si-specific) subunit beta [Saprospiraceae bacterium]|uniref:NAD(P) transhydrogenase subunit beta n=1 Tax=Candidatus Defluviibacterium haderslevense TaxID=2981993 RepID=A0A9D7XHK5_9BACT|nr:NAD(P)(+) transhydrogenase (Re/Si-specific) subunit beta [Candidatus Defluviibacterium haderslevense]MBK9717793.1 NAD(P)(+) transhydrogenase (Re/Si-specific) subunit beta [Candidatus Defluviibacterium haderslevense]MBL0237537.1 NAD(P)(+) transhydrogenase (Re/Si-specific) subunit beta [Candidatus Defluviibacterium haderslevense]